MANYQKVVKVLRGFHDYRMFLTLECGHEVYRYSKSAPDKVICEHCNRSAWFPRRLTKRPADECLCSSDKKHSWKDYTMGHVVLCEWCGTRR